MATEKKIILPKKGLDLFAYRATSHRFWLCHRQMDGLARITEYCDGVHRLTWVSPNTPEEFILSTKGFIQVGETT